MADASIKLSGTYDSIEAYELLEEMRSVASDYLPKTGGEISGDLVVDGQLSATLTGNVTGNVTGTASGNLPLSGGTMTGWLSANTNEFRIRNSKAEHDGVVSVVGGEGTTTGANLYLYGTSHSSQAGRFVLSTTDGVNTKSFRGQPDGVLTWDGKSIPERSYGIDTLSSQAGQNTYTFTMVANSAVIFAKRGNNASISMVTIWDATATTFVTAGTNPISITTSANSTGVTITNTSSSGVSIKILNGGTL